MVTKYERELVNYWKNWKSGMPPFGKTEEQIVEAKVVEPVDMTIEANMEDLADRIWDII